MMIRSSPAAGAARTIFELVLLVSFTVAVYAVVVIGGGALAGTGRRPDVVLAMLATAIVAVALPPVRSRAQAFAARVTLGGDRDPYQVLTRAAEQLAGTWAPEDALPRIAEIVARGTGAARAEVWLRLGDRLRPAAAWPTAETPSHERPIPAHGAPEFPDAMHSVPVLDRGRLTGALAVYGDDRGALDEVGQSLLEDLASHAGLVLRDMSLTAELRHRLDTIESQADELEKSRRRILAAQGDERRRLERAIHDGAQQHLVSLAVKLRLARRILSHDTDRARRLLTEVRDDADAALDSLRELARGIYPPILSDRGIAAAVESQVSVTSYEVRVVDRTNGRRFDRAVEAAVYFCCVEALRPALGPAEVVLEQEGDDLAFTVVHERPVAANSLTHLEDRVVSFDGSFEHSPLVVAGRIPLSPGGAP